MVTDNTKKLIGLTDYQRQRVEEFLEAAKQMKNAGVYAFSNHNTGSAYFVNSLNVNGFGLGEDECEAPFNNDFESVEQVDIAHCGGIDMLFTAVFDNYAYPYDILCFEPKEQQQ